MAVINPPKLPSLLLNKGPKGGYYVIPIKIFGMPIKSVLEGLILKKLELF